MAIGSIELLVILSGFAVLGIQIWAIVDAATRPQSEWDAVGSSKTMWIVLIAVFAFVCGIVGLVLAIVYLASVRPRLRAVHPR